MQLSGWKGHSLRQKLLVSVEYDELNFEFWICWIEVILELTKDILMYTHGEFLSVQWLGLRAFTAKGPGSISSRGN